MALFPRFTERRRVLQLGRYGLRHGVKLFEKLNRTNVFLAAQFANTRIACNVCGQESRVWFEMLSSKETTEHKVGPLRETLECLNCLSRMRYRIMAHGILEECRHRFGVEAASLAGLAGSVDHIDILDTDAFSPVARVLAGSKGYKTSSYVPSLPPGLMPDGGYNVDLQDVPFPDGSFDMILTSDVMEHVRDFALANQEIRRCLKPGGAHIFTVPFASPQPTTRIMIDSSTAADIYLEPPQLHGDDQLSGKIPAYRIFGWDVLDHLRGLGFTADAVHIRGSASGIYDQRYFVARRKD